MPANPFDNFADSPSSAAADGFAITPHASADLPAITKAIYVGGGGDLTVRLAGAIGDVTFRNVAAGTILDLRLSAVRSGGTTASFLIGLA